MPRLAGPALAGVSGASSLDIWAVGDYTDSSPPISIHWDGARWSNVPQAAAGVLADIVAISPNDVWAVGAGPTNPTFTAEHWDGVAWSRTHVPDPGTGGGTLYGVDAVSSSDVWAVGNYVDQGLHPLTEHWDGSTWTAVFAPDGSIYATNEFYKVSAVASDDVWAVGYQDVTGNADFQPLIEHWDGRSWSVVQSPVLPGNDDQLFDVYAIASNDVWAVGGYDSGPAKPLAEHWNGSTWSVVQVPFPPGALGNPLFGVSASSSTDVWVVGTSVLAGGSYQPLSAHWDGGTWNLIPTPDPGFDASLNSVVALPSTVAWAVGGYYSHAQVLRPLAEHSVQSCS